MSAPALQSRILKVEPIDWRSLNFIQQDDFKKLPKDAEQKLKASLINNNFVEPFYVWEASDGELYCLDGRHRSLILEELLHEGHQVPLELPAVFIDCADMKEAAKLVLVFSSTYARVTKEGIAEFIQLQDLDLPDLATMVDLPYIGNLASLIPSPTDDDPEEPEEPQQKPAVMVLTFENPEQLQAAEIEIKELLDRKYPGAYMAVKA